MSGLAFTPFKIRNLLLHNRFIKSATFEGMSKDGVPSLMLASHHARLAKGGVAMTTVAYGAVSEDGRTNGDQMVINNDAVPHLQHLSKAVHESGAAIMLQLTHCGFFTRNTSVSRRLPLAPSRVINKYGLLSGIPFSRAMNPADLKQTIGDFGRAAILAKEAGFDAVEVHMGHGYLLSQFLSPRFNRRTDQFGGSLDNRMRYPLQVLLAVRDSVGQDFPVFCKINMQDGFRGGLTIDDAITFARRLEQGGADALVLSGGYTSKTPFFLMRGDVPLKDMINAQRTGAEKAALALFGRAIIKKYAFSENFFLSDALKFRETLRMPLVYLGGISTVRGIEQVMSSGFDMIGMARALIHDPDFINKLQENTVTETACNRCNVCVAEMDRNGVRCVL